MDENERGLLMDAIHEEEYRGLNIKIFQDNDTFSPSEWGDTGIFLVGYHRDFYVEAPLVHYMPREKRSPEDKGHVMFSKEELIAFFEKDGEYYDISFFKDYHVFPLEAYIHSGVSLALADEGNFPDRQWDVSLVGAVLISKKEKRTRKGARKLAEGLIDTWNDYLSGNVYGFMIEDAEGNDIDSCWGFYGEYDAEGGALSEAKSIVDHKTECGKTDHKGQVLMF